MTLIDSLKWRYATKKFDPNKKVSDADLATIKEAIQLTATSYGLQLYKVLVIEDAETREKLKPAAWGQGQITDASQLFVFCAYTSVTPEMIDEYLQLKSDTQGMKVEDLKGYGDFMKGALGKLSPEMQQAWNAKQVYIALGNLLAACGELKVDACPMEGFDPAQFDEILGLKEKGLTASVLATVGYRSDEDKTKDAPKVRKSQEDLFETI